MTAFDDDLASMFTDLPSVSVTFGEAAGLAFLSLSDDDVLTGMEKGVVGEVRTIEFPTTRFPGLKIGSAVTVDGANYTVRDRRRSLQHVDGAITEADLVKAP
jgi:hypothetical protein